jgi:hypothetical protein
MADHDEHPENEKSPDESRDDAQSEDLSERISEALAPALSSVSVRVAEAVTSRIGGEQDSSSDQEDDSAPDESESEDDDVEANRSDGEDADESDSDHEDETDDQSFVGRAVGKLKSSFLSSLKDEGGDQLESVMDSVVNNLWSRKARGATRRLADETLQATLYDALKEIDDPQERSELYRDTLRKLRPVVREAVDAMYTDDSRETLKRQLHGAIPSIVNGDFQTAFRMIVDALSEVTNYAEQAVWENSGEVLTVFQQISTQLLEEKVQDEAEERIDPEAIQQKIQDQADKAREKLQETVGSVQEGVQSMQQAIGARTGGGGSRGGPGMPPSGSPPGGFPPSGFPPSGRPPSGKPPSGKPPSGRPPSGSPPSSIHPGVARVQREQSSAPRNPRTRRLPER